MIDKLEEKLQTHLNIQAHSFQLLRLGIYTFIIIVTQMISSVWFQKIYKVPYTRSGSLPDIDGNIPSDTFQNPFGLVIFQSVFGIFFGYWTTPNIQNQTPIPRLQLLKVSFLNFLSLTILIKCMIMTSYITVTIINNSQLVVIVLMAVFLSKSSPRFRVHKRQIIIALFLCLGIALYNVFNKKDGKGPNKPVTWVSGILLLILVLAGGYRPEVLAQIRDKYSPAPSYLYYTTCCYTTALAILVSAITGDLWRFGKFIWQHDQFLLDLTLNTLFFAFSYIFVYRGTMQYKQHVMPTIEIISKLFTLILNAILFKHNLNVYQYISIIIIFGAILIDVYLTKLQGQKTQRKQKNLPQKQDRPQVQNPFNTRIYS